MYYIIESFLDNKKRKRGIILADLKFHENFSQWWLSILNVFSKLPNNVFVLKHVVLNDEL
jgi:hypothetical protein